MYEVEEHENYIEVRLSGTITLDGLVEFLESLLRMPRYADSNDLWDLRQADSELAYEDLNRIRSFILAAYPLDTKRSRTALVVGDGMTRAIAELWCQSEIVLPYDVEIFHSHPEAEAWVCQAS